MPIWSLRHRGGPDCHADDGRCGGCCRHRDYFLPGDDPSNHEVHAKPPTAAQAWASLGLLVLFATFLFLTLVP